MPRSLTIADAENTISFGIDDDGKAKPLDTSDIRGVAQNLALRYREAVGNGVFVKLCLVAARKRR